MNEVKANVIAINAVEQQCYGIWTNQPLPVLNLRFPHFIW